MSLALELGELEQIVYDHYTECEEISGQQAIFLKHHKTKVLAFTHTSDRLIADVKRERLARLMASIIRENIYTYDARLREYVSTHGAFPPVPTLS